MIVTPFSAVARFRFTRSARLAFAALVIGFAIASGASAEKADRDKPINFSGDSGDANLQARGGALTGNVIITQGTLTIRADRILFKQNADNSLSATAYGNPVTFRQKRDGVDEYYEGFAQRIEYDGSKEFLELFDRALLKRGQDEIRSNYVSYNAATELFRAEGRASSTPDPTGPGTRVRGMFQPKDSPGKAKDAAKDSAKTGATSAVVPGTDAPISLKPAGDLAPPGTK